MERQEFEGQIGLSLMVLAWLISGVKDEGG